MANKLSIVEQEKWKSRINLEETAAKLWKGKWGWILDENEKVYKKMAEITGKSLVLQQLIKKETPDKRTITPIPESVNHQYGWISTRPEFQLQIYGPDVIIPKPPKEEF